MLSDLTFKFLAISWREVHASPLCIVISFVIADLVIITPTITNTITNTITIIVTINILPPKSTHPIQGLLWVQHDKLFSRWKERFVILTADYIQVRYFAQ